MPIHSRFPVRTDTRPIAIPATTPAMFIAQKAFTREAMSEEQREVFERILELSYGAVVQAVAQARGLEEAEVRAIVDRGLLTAREAVEAGLAEWR